MINSEQISHDLAVAKLVGLNLSAEETLDKYATYREEFLQLQNKKSSSGNFAKAESVKNPFR